MKNQPKLFPPMMNLHIADKKHGIVVSYHTNDDQHVSKCASSMCRRKRPAHRKAIAETRNTLTKAKKKFHGKTLRPAQTRKNRKRRRTSKKPK